MGHLEIGTCRDALVLAARSCGLEFVAGQQRFKYHSIERERLPAAIQCVPDLSQCDHVLRLVGPSLATLTRRPHEIGVFDKLDGGAYLIWDIFRDGFGLVSFIGAGGRRLLQAFRVEATRIVLNDASWYLDELSMRQDQSIQTLFHYGDDMGQRIDVIISPKGEVTMHVSGVTGEGCKAVTADLEKALGTVIDDKPTSDLYAQNQEQHIHGESGSN